MMLPRLLSASAVLAYMAGKLSAYYWSPLVLCCYYLLYKSDDDLWAKLVKLGGCLCI